MSRHVEMRAQAFVVLLCLVILGWWIADRRPPVTGRTYAVLNAPRPGGELLLRVSLQRLRVCQARVERRIEDAARNEYLLRSYNFAASGAEELGPDTYIRPIELPNNITPGEATLRQVFTYVCNPIHKVAGWPIVEVTEVRFTVSP